MRARRAVQCGYNAGQVNRNERRQSNVAVESAFRVYRAPPLSFSPPLAPSNWDDETSTGAPESLSRESNREPGFLGTITHTLAPFCSEARAARADKTYEYSGARPADREVTFPGQRRVDNIAETMFP